VGLKSLLTEKSFYEVAAIVVLWLVVIVLLSFIPVIGTFVIAKWGFFGFGSILMTAGFILGSGTPISRSDLPILLISAIGLLFAGTLGPPILVSVWLYFYIKIRRNEKKYELRSEGSGKEK